MTVLDRVKGLPLLAMPSGYYHERQDETARAYPSRDFPERQLARLGNCLQLQQIMSSGLEKYPEI